MILLTLTLTLVLLAACLHRRGVADLQPDQRRPEVCGEAPVPQRLQVRPAPVRGGDVLPPARGVRLQRSISPLDLCLSIYLLSVTPLEPSTHLPRLTTLSADAQTDSPA